MGLCPIDPGANQKLPIYEFIKMRNKEIEYLVGYN